MLLEDSCHCSAIKFEVEYPNSCSYNMPYCSVCRKTARSDGIANKFGAYYFLILVLILAPLSAYASEEKKRDADQAAGKWLALVDGLQYRDSWNNAASLFKQQVKADQWLQAITAARKPLGNMISRKLVSATYATSLPGAPDGEYVVLQYQTVFENKKSAIETVTPMLDNNSWRVSGYFIR